MSTNVWVGIGRLGQDPQIRWTTAGKAVANFSIAVDSGFGDKKTTSWIDVVAWEKTAELIQQYVVKGSRVAVTGRLQSRSWDDKNTGAKRTKLEVIADHVDFLTVRSENTPIVEDTTAQSPEISDEDIPF